MGEAGHPVGVAGTAADGVLVELERMEQMLETGTASSALARDRAERLAQRRRAAARAAQDAGARLVALATSPQPASSSVTAKPRHRRMLAEFGLTAREQLTCGCHVHVEVVDADEGVAVLDRIGPWLACLLALSANSPFWHGEDTGYSSYRSQVWRRWPTAGPTDPFGTPAQYAAVVDGLVASGAALDAGMIYFDARLSQRYPTVEIRVPDVCLRAPDALLLGLLARGLVETASRGRLEAGPPAGRRAELLRAAAWLAARHGLQGPLVNPLTLSTQRAPDVINLLLDQVRPVLLEHGEWDLATRLWSGLRARGTGAQEQRAWAADGLTELIRRAAVATVATSAR